MITISATLKRMFVVEVDEDTREIWYNDQPLLKYSRCAEGGVCSKLLDGTFDFVSLMLGGYAPFTELEEVGSKAFMRREARYINMYMAKRNSYYIH